MKQDNRVQIDKKSILKEKVNKFSSSNKQNKFEPRKRAISSKPDHSSTNLKFADSQPNIDYCSYLIEKKQSYYQYLNSTILSKFSEHLLNLKVLRNTILEANNQQIIVPSGSSQIPIPRSLYDNFNLIRSQPLNKWIKINTNLNCHFLEEIPYLNPQYLTINSNKYLDNFVEKILETIFEIDRDFYIADMAIRLQLPEMKDGDYVGINLLDETIGEIRGHQFDIIYGK